MKINELRKLIRDILSEVGYDTPPSRDPIMRVYKPIVIPDATPPKEKYKVDQKLDGASDPIASHLKKKHKIDPREFEETPGGQLSKQWFADRAKHQLSQLQNQLSQFTNGSPPNSSAKTQKPSSQALTQKENKMKINELRNIIMEEYKNIKKEYNPNRALIKRIRHELDKVIFLLQEDEKETAIKLITRIKDMIDR